MFVARDSDGLLYLYENRPYRRKDGRVDEWLWRYNEKHMQLDYKLFLDLGWEDEPIEVELIVKKDGVKRRRRKGVKDRGETNSK